MNRRGFTIVELLIVIAIMGILLVLGVVNLRGSQANARDSERKIDIEVISQALEVFYINGNGGATQIGRYPSITVGGWTKDSLLSTFQYDTDIKSFVPPGIAIPSLGTDMVTSFVPATGNIQTPTGVQPQPTKDQYVYQPIKSDSSLCIAQIDCRKYNLYYRLEADNTVYMVTSKRQ